MKKAQIVNLNYDFACRADDGGYRLRRANMQHVKPWIVIGGDIDGFPTHAEAIRYADKLARAAKIRELRALEFYDLSPRYVIGVEQT